MSEITGTVEAVAGSGRAFKIAGNWYGAYRAEQLQGAKKGDSVKFEAVQKGQYLNIQGDVQVLASPVQSAPSRAGYSDVARQEAIIRQNALTNAVAFVLGTKDKKASTEEVIDVAQQFFLYSSGKLAETAHEQAETETESPF